MTAWDNAGLPVQSLPQMAVHDVAAHPEVARLDVRSPSEWEGGHIPNATHRFLPDLRSKRKQPSKTEPVAVYCDSGYRASLAASWLQAQGLKDVRNIPGSWQAWTEAGLPIAKNKSAKKGARS
jgi:hydroxyacylglutathione hydrolase